MYPAQSHKCTPDCVYLARADENLPLVIDWIGVNDAEIVLNLVMIKE